MKTYTYSYQNGLCRGREAGEVPGQIRRRPQGPSGYLGRGVLHTPYRAPRHGANTRIRRSSIRARGPSWGAYAVAPRGFAPGYGPAALQAAPASIHSGPWGPVWWGVCNTPLHGYPHQQTNKPTNQRAAGPQPQSELWTQKRITRTCSSSCCSS